MRYTFEGDGILADGEPIATIDQHFWRDRADVVIAGSPWLFHRSGRDLAAEHDGTIVMTAMQEGFWRPRWIVRVPTGTFELRRAGTWGNPFEATIDGALIASIASTSGWSYKPELTTERLAAEEAVFTIWVAKRIVAQAAAAASVSATT